MRLLPQLILRPYGTFSHPNVLAGYLVFSMCFLIFAKNNLFNKRVLFKYIIAAIAALGIVVSLSRSAFIVYIVIMLYAIFSLKRKRDNRLFLLLFYCVLIIFLLDPILASRFTNISLSDESITLRAQLLLASFNLIKNNLV